MPPLKSVRIALPSAWPGKDDERTFDTWLNGLIRYMKINRVCGPDMVPDQIVLVGHCLTGRALDWFDRETAYPRRKVLDWSLEDLLRGLYKRFFNAANVNEPTKRYEALRYTQTGSVKHFADDIEYWGEHMVSTARMTLIGSSYRAFLKR